jgi:hypothetical protein
MRAVIGIEAALAIQTVESADFSVSRHEIDAEAQAEPAAVHWPVYRTWINDCTHIIPFLLQFDAKIKYFCE